MLSLSIITRIENEAARIGGVVSLAQGIPSMPSHPLIREAVCKAINGGLVDGYSLSAGLPALREAFRKRWNMDATDSDVLITAGVMEGIAATCLTFIKPGEEVITFSPYYGPYRSLSALGDGKLVPVPLDESRGWRPDTERLEAAITPATRAILLNSPHNPTGIISTKEELQAIADIAIKHDVLVISDEVYRNFHYDGDEPYHLYRYEPVRDRLLTAMSFSKDGSLSGWRVGFLFGKRELVEQTYAVHQTMVVCAPVVSQVAGLAALRNEEQILAPLLPYYAPLRTLMAQYLDELGDHLEYVLPQGSYYFFPKLKKIQNDEELCFDILRKAKVAIVPGSGFGPGGEGHVRLCFGKSENDIREGMERLKSYFKST